jgi:hypothetical protein
VSPMEGTPVPCCSGHRPTCSPLECCCSLCSQRYTGWSQSL